MGNTNKENLSITKECMATALLMLMEEKPYDEISIQEITNRAGFSRMTYYRNYTCKEDIIVLYLLDRAGDFTEKLSGHKFSSLHELIVQVGLFIQSNFTFALAAVRIGQMERLMNELFSKLFSAFPEIPGNTENEYITSFYVGAVLGVFRKWFERNMEESVYEIADIICRLIDSNSAEKFTAYAGEENQGV
jgi:AcrR family transcriptional regulator